MKKAIHPSSFMASALCASLLVFSLATACQGKGQTSSSTNWLTCRTDADCAAVPHATCRSDLICIDMNGRPIAAMAGSGGAASAAGGSAGEPSASGGSASTGGTSGGSANAAGTSGGSIASGGAMAAGEAGEAGYAEGSGEAGAGGASGGAAGATGGSGQACDDDQTKASPWTAPALDKSCRTASDCFVGQHTFNCCGSIRYVGYNLSQRDDFDEYELSCQARVACECASLLEVEDGTSLNKGAAVAECVDGTCRAVCSIDGCQFTSDCSASDECLQGTACRWINPLAGANLCRGADGTCGGC